MGLFRIYAWDTGTHSMRHRVDIVLTMTRYRQCKGGGYMHVI